MLTKKETKLGGVFFPPASLGESLDCVKGALLGALEPRGAHGPHHRRPGPGAPESGKRKAGSDLLIGDVFLGRDIHLFQLSTFRCRQSAPSQLGQRPSRLKCWHHS